jgi:hypothetical protein
LNGFIFGGELFDIIVGVDVGRRRFRLVVNGGGGRRTSTESFEDTNWGIGLGFWIGFRDLWDRVVVEWRMWRRVVVEIET